MNLWTLLDMNRCRWGMLGLWVYVLTHSSLKRSRPCLLSALFTLCDLRPKSDQNKTWKENPPIAAVYLKTQSYRIFMKNRRDTVLIHLECTQFPGWFPAPGPSPVTVMSSRLNDLSVTPTWPEKSNLDVSGPQNINTNCFSAFSSRERFTGVCTVTVFCRDYKGGDWVRAVGGPF